MIAAYFAAFAEWAIPAASLAITVLGMAIATGVLVQKITDAKEDREASDTRFAQAINLARADFTREMERQREEFTQRLERLEETLESVRSAAEKTAVTEPVLIARLAGLERELEFQRTHNHGARGVLEERIAAAIGRIEAASREDFDRHTRNVARIAVLEDRAGIRQTERS